MKWEKLIEYIHQKGREQGREDKPVKLGFNGRGINPLSLKGKKAHQGIDDGVRACSSGCFYELWLKAFKALQLFLLADLKPACIQA